MFLETLKDIATVIGIFTVTGGSLLVLLSVLANKYNWK